MRGCGSLLLPSWCFAVGRPAGVKNGQGQTSGTRGPVRDSKSSFSLPKLGGAVQLRDLVADYGGIDRVSHDFRIGADLLNRYMVGQLEPPFTLLCCLWWHTSHGFQQGFAEAHWTHQYNTFKRKEAEAKVVYLETVVRHAIQLLEHRVDAADLVRQLLAQVPAERYSGDPLAGGLRLIRDDAQPTGN